jgi:hypothetical protein
MASRSETPAEVVVVEDVAVADHDDRAVFVRHDVRRRLGRRRSEKPEPKGDLRGPIQMVGGAVRPACLERTRQRAKVAIGASQARAGPQGSVNCRHAIYDVGMDRRAIIVAGPLIESRFIEILVRGHDGFEAVAFAGFGERPLAETRPQA